MNIKKYVKKYVKDYPELIKDQNKIEDWEVQFDREWSEANSWGGSKFGYLEELGDGSGLLIMDKDKIKDFIRKTRQDAVEEYKKLSK